MGTIPVDRQDLIEQITGRLESLDDETLHDIYWVARGGTFDAAIEPTQGSESGPTQLNRRQLLAGLLIGGVAVAGTGAAGAPLATRNAYNQGVLDGRAAVKEELTRLRGLIDLYEALERTPIDEVIGAGLAAVGMLMDGLKTGASLLRGAVDGVDSALREFEATLPAIEQGLAAVWRLAEDVMRQLDSLRDLLADGVQTMQPAGDALGGFLSQLVKHLPFGIGEHAMQVFDALGKLLATLPDLLAQLIDGLLKPLAGWFPGQGRTGVQAGLFSPLRQSLLAPLRDHLEGGQNLAEQWEARLANPSQRALEDRAQVRAQIKKYRQEYKV